jgi:hypothetical protein
LPTEAISKGRLRRQRSLLPQGKTLPYAAWRHRHHAMVGLLFAESVGLVIFSFAEGNGWFTASATRPCWRRSA